MRLGQLARKLAIRPSAIIEFLAAKNISLEESSNTRLEDDQVILIMSQFATASTADAMPALTPSGDPDATDVPIAPEAPADHGAGLPKDQTGMEDKPQESSPASGTVVEVRDVIKAPKVELSGLKVVGKIDLPELRKKELPGSGIESSGDNPAETEKKVRLKEKSPSPYKNDRTEQRPARKNPMALQREREAQEAETRRQAKAEQEKEQRTKNYYKKVKVSAPTKRIKMVDEPTTEMTAAELRETPRTWIGRFLKWLKT
ncbi:MAG TPA: hypothetical protein VK517_00365 [Cyclobacteriaceae bacterium]|nr:hypothetical protein [Cyclobacteriaceae bacterium]